jgi:hypothetical protein
MTLNAGDYVRWVADRIYYAHFMELCDLHRLLLLQTLNTNAQGADT